MGLGIMTLCIISAHRVDRSPWLFGPLWLQGLSMTNRLARILAYRTPMINYLAILSTAAGTLLTSTGLGSSTNDQDIVKKIEIAKDFDIKWQNNRPYIADSAGHLHQTTLDADLQLRLQAFIAERGTPISAVVVSDVMTGKILAMVQGRTPDQWGGATHTALHNRFPAASLFKTVVTAAALEMTPTSPDQNFGLQGGCGGQDILPKGEWMNDDRGSRMTLRRAFGHSCNSFFAKLAVNQLGIGTITHFARLFGWEHQLPTDFAIEPSKMLPPPVGNSTTHTVGRFAAGFGQVSISPVHANWLAATIANKGKAHPLMIFSDQTNPHAGPNIAVNVVPSNVAPSNAAPSNGTMNVSLETTKSGDTLMTAETASRLMDVMRSTVDEGTASNIFWKGRYRSIAQETGGKTGTLNGRSPIGLTTLFLGVYPLSRPQIAVSAVVVLQDRYYFKASQLGAEAILGWRDLQDTRNGIVRSASSNGTVYPSKASKRLRHHRRR